MGFRALFYNHLSNGPPRLKTTGDIMRMHVKPRTCDVKDTTSAVLMTKFSMQFACGGLMGGGGFFGGIKQATIVVTDLCYPF
jgi:hypothetical protein